MGMEIGAEFAVELGRVSRRWRVRLDERLLLSRSLLRSLLPRDWLSVVSPLDPDPLRLRLERRLERPLPSSIEEFPTPPLILPCA